MKTTGTFEGEGILKKVYEQIHKVNSMIIKL
jgi:hypothetical protein